VLRPFQSLRHAIVLGVALCVLIPALLLGGLVARDRYADAYRERVTAPLQQYANILVHGLVSSIWNVDSDTARQLADAVLINPDVVRISVEDSSHNTFLQMEHPERRKGEAVFEKREIRRDGQVLGYLTIELSTGRIESELLLEAVKLGVTLLVQLVASFVLILLLLENRLINPLREIRNAAQKLATGELDRPITTSSQDEIGELARHLDAMRLELRDAFGELEAKRIALVRELDEHGQAEAALHANHEFTQTVIESLPGIFYLINPDGRFVLWNHNFEAITGRNADEIPALHPLDLFDGPDRTTIAKAIEQVFASGEAVAEASLIRADGVRQPYLFTGLKLDMSGAPHLLGVGIDLGARRRAEEALATSEAKFSAAFHGSYDYITISRLSDSHYLAVNEAFERLSGWTSEEALASSALELGIWVDAADRQSLVERLRVGDKIHDFPMRMKTKAGATLECLVSAFVVSIAGEDCMVAVARDVTEARQTEQALRASEAKFAAAINGSVDFISLSRLEDGCFTLVNEAFEKLTGWRAEEAIGRTSLELGIWRNPEEREELVRRVRLGEHVRNYFLHLGTRHGEIRECVMSAVQVTIEGGAYMVAVVRDETEQRKADRALRRLAQGGGLLAPAAFYEDLVTDLVEALGFAVGFIGFRDPAHPSRIVTRAAFFHGTPRESFAYEAKGAPCEGVLAGQICIFTDHVAEQFPQDEALARQGLASYVGAPLRDDAGAVIGLLTVMDTKPLTNPDLARSLVQVFAERASGELARERAGEALAASQQKFSALFHSSPVAMTVSRRAENYAVVDANIAWEQQFRQSRAEVIGRNGPRLEFWRNLEDRAAVLSSIEKNGEIHAYEAWLKRGDGTEILCLISGRMVALEDDELLILAEEDITERRRLERELAELAASHEQRVVERTEALRKSNDELATTLSTLQRAQSELVRSEKLAALGALVAGVAHELNTPIGNCITVASTLDEQVALFVESLQHGVRRSTLESFTGSARLAADILLRNLRRASELVVSFKQVAVDQTSSQRREFALEEVVAEILLTLQPTIRKSHFVVDYEIPAEIVCDSYPGPLGQVVANLINNALLHAFEGREQGTVRISARMLADAYFELTVADDGCGIAAADQSRIFDPFFTTKLGKGGSGLGLHIVYNLVTGVLGGDIAVYSESGRGARFVIAAPLVAPMSADSSDETA
jgi:PAS domain S-box-containing protein